MKLFLFVLVFSFSSCYSQKSTLEFLSKFNFELNGNLSRLYYNWSEPYETSVNYPIPTSSALWINSDIGLNYKSRWFKSGVNFYFLRAGQFQATVGMNALGFLNNQFIYLGPLIGYSHQLREVDLDKKHFAKIGIESYLKNYHFALSYSRSIENSASNSNHLNGIMLQIGRNLNVFEKEQNPFLNLTNKVHFELNVGYGLCNYERLIKSPKYNYYYYEDYKESLLQVQAGLSFRNKKYNFGLMYNHLNLFSVHPQNKADFLNLKFGLNLMSCKKNWYLGPYGLYGHSLNSKPINGAFEYIEIGLESYVKNIHLSIGYQIYQDYSWEENKTAHMHSLHLTLGYAISFGKKSTAKP